MHRTLHVQLRSATRLGSAQMPAGRRWTRTRLLCLAFQCCDGGAQESVARPGGAIRRHAEERGRRGSGRGRRCSVLRRDPRFPGVWHRRQAQGCKGVAYTSSMISTSLFQPTSTKARRPLANSCRGSHSLLLVSVCHRGIAYIAFILGTVMNTLCLLMRRRQLCLRRHSSGCAGW